MTPSTWPALIVGAFTLLQGSPANVEPVKVDVKNAAVPSAMSTAQDYTVGLGDLLTPSPPVEPLVTTTAPTTVTTTFQDGSTYSYTINANGPYVVPPTKVDAVPGITSPSNIDHMPIVGYGIDPNKIDPMNIWTGGDPNLMDPMTLNWTPKKAPQQAVPSFTWSAPNAPDQNGILKGLPDLNGKQLPNLFDTPAPPPTGLAPLWSTPKK